MQKSLKIMIVWMSIMCSGAASAEVWTAMAGACPSTDNNFSNRAPSSDYPVARFATPGGSLTFNSFHDGYIAVHCNVTPPASGENWNRLQVTYRDPDGRQGLGGEGTTYQTYVELIRMSKTDGSLSRVALFDSNLQCEGVANCQATDIVKTFTLPFSHTFDFTNYTYAVFGRLYRGLAIFGLRPALYQVRLQTN